MFTQVKKPAFAGSKGKSDFSDMDVPDATAALEAAEEAVAKSEEAQLKENAAILRKLIFNGCRC